WLRADIKIKATTIHERLAADPYRFPGSYQRVKEYVRLRRPEIAAELGINPGVPMHRRFETIAGAQAQVDWGHEGTITTRSGELQVYSFHMVLSYSRDPFCCYVTSQDLATFWDCHRRAFDHFSGVPATVLYDRTKTVVKNHVGKGRDADVELHPEALAFAAHYDFTIRLCWPNRPETKGKVERVVGSTREKVCAGRTFASTDEMDSAWLQWLPGRRAQVHRTHGEVIAIRANRDRAALSPLPARPYLVSDRHLRVVGAR
ncbi:MAG: IS21 family transposase, partial [Actinobacteria bacterium]|nr:IS21 family transposase [Actinomycetota bacterium]